MTRFALCTAVHAEAAKRLVNDDELAAAVGVAFARYYAILKNAGRGQKQESKPKPKFVPTLTVAPDDDNVYRIGRLTFTVSKEAKMAWLKVNENWTISGEAWKGLAEIAKVPQQVLDIIAQTLPDDALSNERKLFQFYAELRDRLRL